MTTMNETRDLYSLLNAVHRYAADLHGGGPTPFVKWLAGAVLCMSSAMTSITICLAQGISNLLTNRAGSIAAIGLALSLIGTASLARVVVRSIAYRNRDAARLRTTLTRLGRLVSEIAEDGRLSYAERFMVTVIVADAGDALRIR
jgi:hypothetical protein